VKQRTARAADFTLHGIGHTTIEFNYRRRFRLDLRLQNRFPRLILSKSPASVRFDEDAQWKSIATFNRQDAVETTKYMRTSVQQRWFLALSLVATLIGPGGVSFAQTTNWIAYNDHVPNYTTPVNGWVTHPRATGIDMGESGGTGNLINFLNGQQLPVVITSMHVGSPHAFGLAVEPNDNTPAARIFKGIVDVANTGIIGTQFSQNDYATFTFSGLDPNKHYIFRGTGVRGGGYALRWTVATIIGARTWVDAHINGNGGPGVLTSNNYPASLGGGQAAFNGGDNLQGAVVGWDFISPALDGTFTIQSSNYVGQIPGGNAANNTYSYAIDAMLLAEVEVAAPTITQSPVAQTTVEQNRPFSLSVAASGTPLFYQWYKQGAGAVPGATFATYSVSQASLSQSGDYYAVVYNALASKTSSVAHVTVNADVTGPGIATAFSYPTVDFTTRVASLNQVIIEFNEVIQSTGATDPSHYVISGGIGNPASVILTNSSTVALILSTPLTEDTAYTVSVSGVVDLVGNNISNGGTNNPAAFHSWMRGPGNGLLFEVYDGISGSDVADLLNSPLYPDNATFRTNLWIFDSRSALPDDTRENYGSRFRGVFIPPVSGDWYFYLRGIDISRLFINPNGLDASGKQYLCEEAHADTDGNWGRIVSNPVRLRAGQGYYIEALQKSDTGADFVKVAARLSGAGVPAGVANTDLDTNAVYGAPIGGPLAPRDLGGALTITRQPQNLMVEAHHIATFSIQLNNPSALPVLYKWSRDGTEIPGASGQSYSFEALTGDSGATFSVTAAKLGSSVASGTATLTVVSDTTPPHATNVTSSYTNLSTIAVAYDEFVENGAVDPFSYNSADSDFTVTSVVLEADRRTATLTLQGPLTLGQTYRLIVSGVSDVTGNPIEDTTLTFVAGTDLPRLRIEPVDAYYANITWPAPSTGFNLEQTDNLTSGTWTSAGTATVINGRNVVSIYYGPGNKFYRLRQ
jgi:hypothetical protein